MTTGQMWQFILFFVVPMVTLYVGLLLWSTNKDKWKR